MKALSADHKGDGSTYWFEIHGEKFGLNVREDGHTFYTFLDCDGSPLAVPEEHIHNRDREAMKRACQESD